MLIRQTLRGLKEGTKVKDGVLPGVHILGFKSKNGYSYAKEAVQKAAPLYEGAKVYADHRDDRSINEVVGVIEGVQYSAQDGLWGNLKLNTGHPMYESYVWMADNMRSQVGLSHSASVEREGKGGDITSIVAVESVDLVTTPATVNGLYEAVMARAGRVTEGVVSDKMAADAARDVLRTILSTVNSLAWDILCDTLASDADKATKLASLLADAAKEARAASKTTPESDTMIDFTKLTREELTKGAPAIVAAIEADAAKAAIAIEAKVTEALAKVPAAARTKVFEKQVRAALADAPALEELIADRLVVAKVEKVTETDAGEKIVAAKPVATDAEAEAAKVREAGTTPKPLSVDELTALFHA